ncbi:MAG TPA: DUF3313 family protein, partial [Sphingomicrobium sp.]|nr:DUF3313 family protein [Sphingomicrobium sp.]
PPANWDGLAQVPAKNVDYLYLRPGADFRQYKAIILEPTQVAFRKNWQRDMNRSRSGLSKVSDSQLRSAIDQSQEKVRSTFEKRFRETGFQIVTQPADNALKVFVGIANVDVSAPEMNSARSRTYAEQAGYGTLVIEVRDSVSGELLGRAVDHGTAGDHFVMMRNSVNNWADFERLFDDWAMISAKGFRKLVESSPGTAR